MRRLFHSGARLRRHRRLGRSTLVPESILAPAAASLLPVLVFALVIGAGLGNASGTAAAAGAITLVVNGRTVQSDAAPFITDGTTLVPVRVVSENLGASVQWDQATRTVTIGLGSTRIVLTVGRTTATVNDRSVVLSQAARIVAGRTFVPLRFVSEALGASVDWDQQSRRVTVTLAAPVPADQSQPAVEGLSWQMAPGVARFVIVTNGPVHYRALTLAKNDQYPDRLLIDIENASLQIPAVTPVGQAGVKQIRAFTQDVSGTSLARVVFDTDEPVRYSVWATWDSQAPLGLGDLPAEFKPGQQAVVVEIEYKVSGVEFVDDPGSERVVVHLNGPADFRVWEASDPWRVVIDARRATLTKALEALSNVDRTITVGKFGVSRIRYSQFNIDPDMVRIVLDGDSPVPYQATQEGNDIVVYLGGSLTITGFDYTRLDTGGRLTVWAGRPVKPTVTRLTGPDRLVIEFKGARLGGTVRGGGSVNYGDDIVLDVAYADDPARQVTTFNVNLRGPVAAQATPTDEGAVIDIGRSPLAGRKIVVDPGHGGTDPGAIAPNGVREAVLTLKIGLKLAELLQGAGAEVVLTRSNEADNPDKYARPALANASGADALVGVHLNANDRPAVCGTETYYYHPESRPLAEAVQSRLLDVLGRPDGGVRWADFVLTREARMPAILVEGLYLTNPADLDLLMRPTTLDSIALAIFEGLEDYFARQPSP